MTTQTKLITADELLMMPDDGYRYELLRGVLIRKMPPGDRHGKAIWTGAEFANYVRANSYRKSATGWNTDYCSRAGCVLDCPGKCTGTNTGLSGVLPTWLLR